MSTPLKHAIIDYHEPAWKIAAKIGISEVRMSRLVRGSAIPRDEEKQALAKILGRSGEELFPEPNSPVAA